MTISMNSHSFTQWLASEQLLTFQLFHETDKEARPKILHGTLEQHQVQLAELNRQGYGVFMAVNQTDGLGRKTENIVQVRAYFADFDDPDPTTPSRLLTLPIPPSCIIESSANKFHAYWLADQCELAQFSLIQKALAHKLGSDPKISDLARVMRLPSFDHCKTAQRFTTHIVHLVHPSSRYTPEQMINGLGLVLNAPLPATPKSPALPPTMMNTLAPSYGEGEQGTAWGLSALAQAVTTMELAQQGERNHTLNQQGFKMGQLIAGGELERYNTCQQLSAAALAVGLEEQEINQTLNRAIAKGKDSPRSNTKPSAEEAFASISPVPPAIQPIAQGNDGVPQLTYPAQIPMWLRGWVINIETMEFYQLETGRSYSYQQFNLYYRQYTQASKLAKQMAPSVEGVRYMPAIPKPIFLLEGRTYANSYRGGGAEAIAGDGQAVTVITEHLALLLPDENERQILTDWLAYQVQYAGHKMSWAPLIQGAQGCGKTALATMLMHILGTENVTPEVSAKSISHPNFNAWAEGDCVKCIEEIKITGSKYDVLNGMKTAISNDWLEITRKGQDPYYAPNTANYIILTNFVDALPIDDGDRRYAPMMSGLQTSAQVQSAMGGDYFERLFDVITNKAGELKHWLLHYPISEQFKPKGRAPITRSRSRMIDEGKTELQMAIEDIIALEQLPTVSNEIVVSAHLVRSLPPALQSEAKSRKIANALNGLGYLKGIQRLRIQGSEKTTVWYKQPLTEAEAIQFAKGYSLFPPIQ